MLKWVVKQRHGDGDGGDATGIGPGHYRTLSEDRHRRQHSIDSSISSASSNRTANSKTNSQTNAGKERIGRSKQRQKIKAYRAKSSSGILEQASYNKVQDWEVKESKEEVDDIKDLKEGNTYCDKIKPEAGGGKYCDKIKPETEFKPQTNLDCNNDNKTTQSSFSYSDKLSHILSLNNVNKVNKVTSFRDTPTSSSSSGATTAIPIVVSHCSRDVPHVLKDEGIDDPESADFDPNIICGSKMSMMDESFELDHCNEVKSIKSDQSETGDHSSENRSENGDSSTDSAVVMSDVVSEPEAAKKSEPQGLQSFAAGVQNSDLGRMGSNRFKERREKKEKERSSSSSSDDPVAPPRNRSKKQKSQKDSKKVTLTEDTQKEEYQERGVDCPTEEEEEEEGEMGDELKSLPQRIFMRGSDPLIQTARGKLQSRRSRLNEEINKMLMLRAGAENLYKATRNEVIRNKVMLELKGLNISLQGLKANIADLNSSVQVYQSTSEAHCAPMIPLGLKETKDVDFTRPFSEMIEKHYHEDPHKFKREIQHVNAMRQACRTPVRSDDGLHLLFEYYNQLFFIDRRFFPARHTLATYFEWFDSLTGVPNSQRTVGFEKGSILFNIGALHTQIACRQDRSTAEGIERALEHYQQAAGVLQYLNKYFSNAPSTDMQPDTLDMLTQLMLAQAQECLYEKRICQKGDSVMSTSWYIDTAHEAAQVYTMYHTTRDLMMFDKLKTFLPQKWLHMVTVKGEYFRGISQYYTALSFLSVANNNNNNNTGESGKKGETGIKMGLFNNLYAKDTTTRRIIETALVSLPPKTADERKLLAKAHLRESILSHNEAIRVYKQSMKERMSMESKTADDPFLEFLQFSHDLSLQNYGELEEEDEFTELAAVPHIQGHAAINATPTPPDFSAHRISSDGSFTALGPVAIFSARHRWSPRRTISLRKTEGREYGFSVRGDVPCCIAAVETGSIAQKYGIGVGDFLVGIGEVDIMWSSHEEVVSLIRAASNHLVLSIITPMDRNYVDPNSAKNSTSGSAGSTSSLPKPRNGRSNSHGHLLDYNVKPKASTVAVRPLSASTSSRRFSIGEGTLKKNAKNGSVKGKKEGKSSSVWTLRRNRSKSREKMLEEISQAGRVDRPSR